MDPDRVEREIFIEAPLGVVWAVLTEPEHVGGWFSDAAEIDLRPGGVILLDWEGNGSKHGQVVKVDPPRHFSYRWIRGGPGEAHEGNSTLVEFSLSAEDDGTLLRVVETGFARLDWSEDARKKDAQEHLEGWEVKLSHLRDYVLRHEGGEP